MQIEPLQMTPVKMSATSHLNEMAEPLEVKSFGEFLTDALQKTNALQQDAAKLNAALAAGKIDDVSQVVVASEKADIALQLTLQVRNRAVDAYQEIMRMQV